MRPKVYLKSAAELFTKLELKSPPLELSNEILCILEAEGVAKLQRSKLGV